MYACVYTTGLEESQKALLKDCAVTFSPRVEEPGPDLLLLDLRGLKRILGTPGEIAERMAARISALGITANIAIAADPSAAIPAARGITGITVIEPGEESRVLGSLPLDVLAPDEDLRDTFECWGVRTFSDLAALPETGVAERVGTAGVALRKLARGESERPLIPTPVPVLFEDSMDLDYSINELEPLSFILSRLLHTICGQLQSYGLAANEIELKLNLDHNKGDYIRNLHLPFAGRDANTFLKLLQFDLAAHPPNEAIRGIALHVNPVPPRTLQNGLFLPTAPEPEKLELTLARIAAIVGEQNVGSPELLDTHRRGAFRMTKFESKPASARLVDPPCRPHLAIRIFRPPLPARVQAPFGRPQRIDARGIRGKITSYAGPWRSSGDWWTLSQWGRDEWDIGLENGELYRIYRTGEEWFVEGNYD